MTTRFKDHILPAGLLSARPAASAVPAGSIYPATDTGLLYRNDGTTWAVWAPGLPSGGTVDEVLTRQADGSAAWGAPAASGITVQDENANVATGVTQIDFQGAGVTTTLGTGEVTVTIPGGGGGSSGPALTPASPTHPLSGTTLPAGVTAVGYSTGYSVHDGLLEVTTGMAAGNYFYVAAPAGDWTAVARMFAYAEGSTMFGLMGLDGSGNGIAAGWYNSNPNGPIAATISGAVYGNSFSGVGPARPQGSHLENGIPCWYRLRKAGTTYYASLSPNGEVWTAEASLTGGPSTATRIAVGSFYGTTQRWAVDFINIA